MQQNNNHPIKSFQDLNVYKNLYRAMILVHTKIIPNLPKEEKYDLADQMRRASKAAPALLAEGFAKRFQTRQWMKYLNDTIGECNEMINHISVCIDLYSYYVNSAICKEILEIYNIGCKQLTKLGQSWQNYHDKKNEKCG